MIRILLAFFAGVAAFALFLLGLSAWTHAGRSVASREAADRGVAVEMTVASPSAPPQQPNRPPSAAKPSVAGVEQNDEAPRVEAEGAAHPGPTPVAASPPPNPSEAGPLPTPPSTPEPQPPRSADLAPPPAPGSRRADEERDPCNYRSLRIGAGPLPQFTVSNYVPTLKLCKRPGVTGARVALRSMRIGTDIWQVLADPDTLETSLEREQAACWSCEPTSDDALRDTRLMRALRQAAQAPGVERRTFLQNAGLQRGAARGSFVTGDLCPSRRPLDRRFFKLLSMSESRPTPIALSITGLWLKSHEDDFRWLQGLERDGELEIVWINHSYTHPYESGRGLGETFMLTANLNADFEILETERGLIAHGGIPSLFFRFPGLISSSALMETLRRYHLIPLGADAWLAKGEKPRAGSIILVHPNGNEETGLDRFEKLYREGRVLRPLEPITVAPARQSDGG